MISRGAIDPDAVVGGVCQVDGIAGAGVCFQDGSRDYVYRPGGAAAVIACAEGFYNEVVLVVIVDVRDRSAEAQVIVGAYPVNADIIISRHRHGWSVSDAREIIQDAVI